MPIEPLAVFVAVPIVGLTAFGVYFICRSWAEEPSAEAPTAEDAQPSQTGFAPATWVLAALYIVMGLPKLGSLSTAVHQFHHWGYPETFMYVIGILEFLGAIGLLLPKIRFLAAVGLSVIMAGAIYTHIAFDPAGYVALPTVSLALLVFVGYISYRDEWNGS